MEKCLQDQNGQREAMGQVIAWPTVELHPPAILAGDDPQAVVLDFVQPQTARRRFRRRTPAAQTETDGCPAGA
jgi:hypothetical protein